MEALSRTDGLPVRDSGPWAKEKLYYVERYMSIFNGGMKYHWPQRAYVDLMAGPGRCVEREAGEEFDGSPILATQSEPQFSTVILVESDDKAATALTTRTAAAADRRKVIRRDCNATATITEVRHVVGRMLTLCFIDNLGLNVTLATIRSLSEGNRPIDFLVTVQVNDLTRNMDTALSSADGDRFDAFFGSPQWREVIRRFDRGEIAVADRAAALCNFYGEQLAGLGYGYVEQLHRLMKNTRNAPLYRLLLASRHPRGAEFFRKIAAIEYGGQRNLRLEG
jgi:three-Cys-motif partner protein